MSDIVPYKIFHKKNRQKHSSSRVNQVEITFRFGGNAPGENPVGIDDRIFKYCSSKSAKQTNQNTQQVHKTLLVGFSQKSDNVLLEFPDYGHNPANIKTITKLLFILTKFVFLIYLPVMIEFSRFILNNGLRVIVHEDRSTPLVAMNILYDAGSKDEDPELTGLAHLVEHLMYGGSANIPDYDTPLQLAGGDNNAFTNNDITDYYLTIPSENAETAFWLESDRMLDPDFTGKKTEIQKNVVIEEFRQRYLNQPYGDAMLLLRSLAYKTHPYRWPAIGMDISHIERITNDNVRQFFNNCYAPQKAILALTGKIDAGRAYKLADHWFGSIPQRLASVRNLPAEHEQESSRDLTVKRNIPSDAIYKAWHIGPRTGDDFYTLDLLTDLLSGGESGRLYNRLVRDLNLFSEINAYITSDFDPGLAVISGKIMKGVKVETAEKELLRIIEELKDGTVSDTEIEKVRNRNETSTVLSNTNIMHKAMNLCIYELLGDAGMINMEVANYRNVTKQMVSECARKYFTQVNCSTLYYLSDKPTD